jgi:hypothetical protein
MRWRRRKSGTQSYSSVHRPPARQRQPDSQTGRNERASEGASSTDEMLHMYTHTLQSCLPLALGLAWYGLV